MEGQNFRAFPGLSLPLMLAPVEGRYCSGAHANKSACAGRDVFQPNSSTRWQQGGSTNALSAVGLSEFAVDKGTTQPYGLSNVGLGRSGAVSLVVAGRMLAGMDSKDFHMALFGLSNMEVNYGGLSTSKTFLSSLAEDSTIASLSFSYTAGCFGRSDRANSTRPSFVLGGYDASVFDANTSMAVKITSAISISNPCQFVVNLASIIISAQSGSGGNDATFALSNAEISDSALVTYIDSVTPYLWLPLSACKIFEKEFRLEWNEAAQLYLINSSTRDWLIRTDRTITFSLVSSKASGRIKNFTLSSSAFDLRVSWPIVEEENYYFPLKRASGINMLGRTFLQETHISVDYERGYFNLSQVVPHTGQAENLVTIFNATNNRAPNGTQSMDDSAKEKPAGISPGIYVGIGLGIITVLVAFSLLLSWRKRWWPFHSLKRVQQHKVDENLQEAELQGKVVSLVEAMELERAELQTREQRLEMAGSRFVHGELPGSDMVHELSTESSRGGTQTLQGDNRQA